VLLLEIGVYPPVVVCPTWRVGAVPDFGEGKADHASAGASRRADRIANAGWPSRHLSGKEHFIAYQ